MRIGIRGGTHRVPSDDIVVVGLRFGRRLRGALPDPVHAWLGLRQRIDIANTQRFLPTTPNIAAALFLVQTL
ncbi:hypothetical protein ACWGRF_08325 [Streptomyces zhihengii]